MEHRAYSPGDFELQAIERRGGMSTVRKAILVATQEVCALKYAPIGAQNDSTSFRREADALGDMEHPGIVRMLGIGTDGTERYLVLEWLEETLEDRIKTLGPVSWNNFYEMTGRHLLQGIRYAHSRGYVHRDLKPLNVMFNDLGLAKITDFGIARNMADVRLGETFARAGSHPWTPAEADDGVDSDRRDLYSWTAICIACLTGRLDYKLTSQLRAEVSRLGDAVPGAILESCLADASMDRPTSATALLWELDDFHRNRLNQTDSQRTLGIEVIPTVHKKLEAFIAYETDPSKRVLRLFEDFLGQCDIFLGSEGELEFFGKVFHLRGTKASEGSPWLVVKDVRPAERFPTTPFFRTSVQFVERQRALPTTATQSRANLVFLEDYLSSLSEREKEEQQRRDEERYLILLQDIVAARMRALRDLPALPYSDGTWEGGEFTAILERDESPPSGEQRLIRTTGALLLFEVVRNARGRIFLRPVGARRGQPPPEGLLQVDTAAQRRSLERQDDAVKILRADLAVSPALKRVLLAPNTADAPETGGRPAPEDLSPDKARVLDAAVGLRQLMVVCGPPGTGKTKLITAVVSRYLHENPDARVLVSAQTHIAIDHVIEKLLQLKETSGRVVRIARTDEDKVSQNVKDALLQNCLTRWCKSTSEASRRFVRERGRLIGLDADDIEISIRLESLVLGCERLRKVVEALGKERPLLAQVQSEVFAASAVEIAQIESATTVALTVEELESERQRLDEQVLRLRDELRALSDDGAQLADLSEDALREWLDAFKRDDPSWRAFRRDLELQVGWLDLLGQLKQFEEIVLRSASVVAGTCVGLGSSDAFGRTQFDLCIIDEASKATATEALIPMVRSRHCLIVGDPRQLPPFEKGALDVEGYPDGEVKETLLDYLIARLPQECIYELTHQYRMCKSIGELISHAFYEKRLINERSDSERASWIKKKFLKPVIWIDTLGAKQSMQGHSFVNRTEQRIALDLLGKLQTAAKRAGARASVAVIAGYAAQARELDARIQRGVFSALSIEVATVDSFQGRESDICIFSVTLSNTDDYLGFLRSMERLNVALSRAKDLLVIIGDQNFCYKVPGENPFLSVIDYIESNPTKCETQNAGQ